MYARRVSMFIGSMGQSSGYVSQTKWTSGLVANGSDGKY